MTYLVKRKTLLGVFVKGHAGADLRNPEWIADFWDLSVRPCCQCIVCSVCGYDEEVKLYSDYFFSMLVTCTDFEEAPDRITPEEIVDVAGWLEICVESMGKLYEVKE